MAKYNSPRGKLQLASGNYFNRLGNGPTVVVAPDSSLQALRNLATGKSVGTVGSGVTVVGGSQGRAIKLTNSAGQNVIVCSAVDAVPNQYATIVHVRKRNNATTKDSMAFGYISGWSPEGVYQILCHLPWSDNTLYFDFGAGGGWGRLSISGQTWTTDTETFVLRGGVLGQAVWRNGTKIGSDSNISTSTPGTADWVIGGLSSIASDDEQVYLHAVFDAEWSDAECEAFSKNPWQIIERDPERIYFIPTGGGATTHESAYTQALTTSLATTATSSLLSAYSQGITLVHTPIASIASNQSLSLPLDLNESYVSNMETTQALNLPLDLNELYGSAMTTDASATFNILDSISFDTLLNIFSSIDISLTAGYSTLANSDFNATVQLNSNSSISASVLQSLFVDAGFTVTNGFATTNGGIIDAALTIALNPAYSSNFNVEINADSTFSNMLSITTLALSTLNATSTISTIFTEIATVLSNYNTDLSLNNNLEFLSIGGLDYQTGISFNITPNYSSDSITGIIELILPDGRKILITGSNRSILITGSERVLDILGSNRHILIT